VVSMPTWHHQPPSAHRSAVSCNTTPQVSGTVTADSGDHSVLTTVRTPRGGTMGEMVVEDVSTGESNLRSVIVLESH
jgi:hypothetical protein